MKTKTWTVINNTGKQADLESGVEKKEVQKPSHITARKQSAKVEVTRRPPPAVAACVIRGLSP